MSTVLVVGSGGREHALAWKLSRSVRVKRLIVAPGGDAYPSEWERWPLKLDREGFENLAQKCLAEKVDLVVVGPDNPLADGIVDVLEAAGVLTFGPKAAAAKIEASKAFAKHLMSDAGVPTAKFFTAKSLAEASVILKALPWPPQMGSGWVIKADGLALGKGVRICESQDEAFRAAEDLIRLSGQVVIEERVRGEELSWMAFCDGKRCALLEPARDYKRVFDGDQGPNTGGMGAFSPVPGVPEEFGEQVREKVFNPVLAKMREKGCEFRGLLYAGLMVDFAKKRLWVLEFNARFGDPETQVLMPRIEGDVLDWFEACARGDLSKMPPVVPFVREKAVFVVGAAKGYPDAPEKGEALSGLPSWEKAPEVPDYFVAGVSRDERGSAVTSGGRVFGALGMGEELWQARDAAYSALKKVNFRGMHFRLDIADIREGSDPQGSDYEDG
jgi:phosphoribosylamine--glycine ligase